MRLIAELTMPNVGSWNGKFTGANTKYTINVPHRTVSNDVVGNYYYNFGDGCGANVEIRQAEYREKVSNKFMGYEWMVESILKNGKIII
jgi:hypothetical protein